jgi:DNA-binding LytR/AlgR family response regulator
MLQIAICDDQPSELENINTYITEYLIIHKMEAEVKKFSHPDKLLITIESQNFHLYLLDIVMPMVSGIELGKEIRRFDREAQIIYVTTEPQFALHAYAASPINYMVKPIDKQQLFDTLTFAISKIDLKEEQTFTVKTSESLRVLNISAILCIEYHSHAAIFTLINGEEIMSRTIRESFAKYIMPIQKDAHFLQCHSSFLINMRRVERFAKDSFTLRGGKIVPIAAKQYPAVRDQYMNFLMTKEVRR